VPVAVTGLRELNAAFALADRKTRLGVRAAQRSIADPIKLDAETLAQDEIRRIGLRWWRMRIGVTRTLVYVAPKERGVKSRRAGDPRRRPNLAGLLMTRAMERALEAHRGELETNVERLLDRIADDFNRGGPTT
jgi:hypothetical protein